MLLMEDEWIKMNLKVMSNYSYFLDMIRFLVELSKVFVDKRFTNSIHNKWILFEKYKKTAII